MTDALARLEVLVGTWSVEASVPDAPTGTATLEWALDGRFLLWRVTIPDQRFPDSLSVIAAADDDGRTFTQHYFDARGTVRIYRMTLADGTLQRDEPDFTPLEFSQRFTGAIASDGQTITGGWESSTEDGGWRKDFDLLYRKVA